MEKVSSRLKLLEPVSVKKNENPGLLSLGLRLQTLKNYHMRLWVDNTLTALGPQPP